MEISKLQTQSNKVPKQNFYFILYHSHTMKTKYCQSFLCFKVQGPTCKLCLKHELVKEEKNLRKMEALTQATIQHAEKKEQLARKKKELGDRMELAQQRLISAEQCETTQVHRLKALGNLV